MNRAGAPYGPTLPGGMSWGDTPWDEAMQLSGSAQVGIGAELLQRYAWWEFEPHQEWVSPRAEEGRYGARYAAGIPGRVRVIYIPLGVWGFSVCGLEADARHRAFLFDPASGTQTDLGESTPDESGEWSPGADWPPFYQDLVVVLEAVDG